MASNNKIDPSKRSNVYCTTIAHSQDYMVWDWLFDRYLNEDNANERSNIIKGLACTKSSDRQRS